MEEHGSKISLIDLPYKSRLSINIYISKKMKIAENILILININ